MDGNVTHLHHPAEQKMGEWVWNGRDFNIGKVEKEKREGKTKRRTVERAEKVKKEKRANRKTRKSRNQLKVVCEEIMQLMTLKKALAPE